MFKSLAILAVVIGSGLATSHPKSRQHAQQAQQAQQAAPAPVVAKSEPVPQPQAPAPIVEVREIHPAVNYSDLGALALVLVGIGIAVMIARQTSAVNKSADAALQQVSLQGEMLRPRLGFEFSANAYGDMIQGRNVIISIDVINGGGVPAYEVIPETWIEWLQHPFQFTKEAIYNKGTPIYVDTKKPTTYRVPLTRRLAPNEIATLRDGGATVCVRIKLTYTALGQTGCSEDAFAIESNGVGVLTKYSRYN